MKRIIKKLLPTYITEGLRRYARSKALEKLTTKENKRFIKYSSISNNQSLTKIESLIAMNCHRIEKGLTMKDMRYGFGSEVILTIISLSNQYVKFGYDLNRVQIKHAVSVLLDYKRVHQEVRFQLNESLLIQIGALSDKLNISNYTKQYEYTDITYFENVNSSFDKFSDSRHSVRNYEGEIAMEDIIKSIELAQNSPSSCNRQSARVYVVENRRLIKDVLSCQVGNRGFGELAHKLVVLTSEVSVYNDVTERNSAYIDGGIYGMNLLYALHFNKIAACTLNCYLNNNTEVKLRALLGVPESEVFISILTLGKAPKEFKVGISARNKAINNYKILS